MITIRDIAKAAGVSTATVSNALNGRSNISEVTRQRILKICEQMGYQSSSVGRALNDTDSKTLLFMVAEFDRQFYLKIIQGISDHASARGYDLIICTDQSMDRLLSRSMTSGCIMLDMNCPDEQMIRRARQGYPIVVLDRQMKEPNIKSVLVNNYDAMTELVQGLVDRGYRRFAFLAGNDTLDTRERFDAFQDVLKSNGIAFNRDYLLSGDFRDKSGIRAANLLMLAGRLPQVLVCANDNMAAGAMRAFQEAGIRVPEDIAVTGFDDASTSEILGLTTVTIPNYERGYLAAQYLIAIINGSTNFDAFMLRARVTWRKSVMPGIPIED
ncbi:MAG: LacI family DNA-binding transcriptional regulator [Clostridia bacterium]|nr:LacI family DNA-binding transcriptional regulator [Clostridia bacterium]